MRVLIISKEAWRDEQNGGNVLSNIFGDFDAEFAQIYCTEGEPNNIICKKYYQMTDRMMIENVFKHKKVGKERVYEDFPNSTKSIKQSYDAIKKLNLDSVRVVREIMWHLAKWDYEGLSKFCNNFSPDVIFAPCYGNHYMIKLTELVVRKLSVPVISYISDDFYTNNQLKLSPIYWINHLILRKNVRKVFALYSLVYTMTDEQKKQCKKDFGANMKVLRKSGYFEQERKKTYVNEPIKMVYGGGIYLNRYRTLMKLVDAIKVINSDDIKLVLDIYTSTPLNERAKRKLNDGKNSNIHQPVSLSKLKEIYSRSDIALHVEGFDRKSASIVKLSFSTKIVDCLDSGCAVMAICEEQQAGFAYLKRNDAAICISDLAELENVLTRIVNNKDILIEYQRKAFKLGRKNHLKQNIDSMLKNDFACVVETKS